tara:strand:- start:625 stop:801 length:177 start_codon:yes stop_codon:yes gene_type:complete
MVRGKEGKARMMPSVQPARRRQEMPGDARRCQVIERKGKKKKVTRGFLMLPITPRSTP